MQDTTRQESTLMDAKSVQEVSKHNKPRSLAKSDLRYWMASIFRPTYTRSGETREVAEWMVKIQYAGRRENFALGTPNKAAAAAKAKDIYLLLQGSGWESVVARFKPKSLIVPKAVTTVGEFLQEVQAKVSIRPKTLGDYFRAFRTIVSGIEGIDGGTAKYDYRSGGREAWLAKVHAVKLADVTPEKVQKWKIEFLRRAGSGPLKQRAAKTSVNSLIRQAKSLFASSVLRFIQHELLCGSPFEGVDFEPRQSMRYRSSFDLKTLIHMAQNGMPDGSVQKLPSEQWKIFLLAVMGGLRRNEIDKLEWSAFRWDEGIIRVDATSSFHPKSEDALGDVEIDPELMEIFRNFKKTASGSFVIEASISPRVNTAYTHYRCKKEMDALIEWLRANGVTGNTPLHTLRKEFGSQMCAKHGIYAASRALRHGDIAITSQHYLDKRRRTTLGLGGLLTLEDSEKATCDPKSQQT